MNHNIKIGAQILYKDMTAWTSKIQQWWWRVTTRKHKAHSHASTYIGKNISVNREQEAEANIWIDITTFKLSPKNMDIWNPKAREQHCVEAVNEALDELEETWYGFTAWIGIPLSGLIKLIFPKADIHRWKIWDKIFGSGTHCTEFTWLVMKKISEKEIIYKGTDEIKRNAWQRFYHALMNYNRNLITPPDQVDLMMDHPQCWEYHGNDYGDVFVNYKLTKKQINDMQKMRARMAKRG